MKKIIPALSAMALFAACGGDVQDAEQTADAGDNGAAGDSDSAAEPESGMLPNGAPPYPGMDMSAAEDLEPDGDRHVVRFDSGDSMFDIINFYRDYYVNDDYDITLMGLTLHPKDGSGGGLFGSFSIRLDEETGGSTITIQPFEEFAGTYDPASQYALGIPAYPNAMADVDIFDFGNGTKRYRVSTADPAVDVWNYYRTAVTDTYDIHSTEFIGVSPASGQETRVKATAQRNADGSRVTVTITDG